MKDRYKYRVWDKENKCLHYPTRYSNFAIVNGTVVKIESYPTANSAYLGKRIAWEFDDAVIMPCTGLKDKNGKLIYEGDIVATVIKNLGGKTIIDMPEVVEYDENLCMFRTNFSTLSKQTEVIGNIYQDKDLLNA